MTSLPAVRQGQALDDLHTALDALAFHVDALDDLKPLAEGLARVRSYRRTLSEIEHDMERRLADLMAQDIVNLGDNVVLERRRGSKRTAYQSPAILAELGKQARVDADGVVQPPNEQYSRLYERVQDCFPLNPSLSWRAGALREYGVDPDEYCTVEPGRVSVRVEVQSDG